MEIVDAIAQAEFELQETLDELKMAKEMVVSLEDDAKKLRVEIVGLRSYAGRKGLGQEPVVPLGDNVHPISADVPVETASGLEIYGMTRSEAVIAVMENAVEALDRNQIHEMFHDNGRYEDTLDQVSLALSGLKRNGRAQKLGHGKWQLIDESPTASSL